MGHAVVVSGPIDKTAGTCTPIADPANTALPSAAIEMSTCHKCKVCSTHRQPCERIFDGLKSAAMTLLRCSALATKFALLIFM